MLQKGFHLIRPFKNKLPQSLGVKKEGRRLPWVEESIIETNSNLYNVHVNEIWDNFTKGDFKFSKLKRG